MNNPTATIEELKATLDAWIPKYIRQVVELRSGNKLTAERYNELMNLLITQGDDTIELAQVVKQYVELLVDGLSNNFVDTTDALTQAFNTTTANVTAIAEGAVDTAEGAVASVTQYKSTMDANMEQFQSTVNTTVSTMASDINAFKTSITESFNATDTKSDNAVATANQLVADMEGYRVDLSAQVEQTFRTMRDSLSAQITSEVAVEAQEIQELLTANLNTAFNNLSAEVTAIADNAVQIANGAVEDVVAYKESMDARLEEALKEVEDSLTAADEIIQNAAAIYDKIDEIDAIVKSFEGRVEAVENSVESIKEGTTPVAKAGDSDKFGGNEPSHFATAQSVANLEDGTTKAAKAAEADNAKTLDGHGAEYFATADGLEAVQSAKLETISSPGWYRIAESDYDYTTTLLIKMGNSYNSGGGGENLILFNKNYATAGFITLGSRNINSQVFTKIRQVTEGSHSYIEVYYALSANNGCSFSILDFSYSKVRPWLAINPVATEETVDGVTVVSTYDIPKNANLVTDLDLANYLPKTLTENTVLDVSFGNTFTVRTYTANSASAKFDSVFNGASLSLMGSTLGISPGNVNISGSLRQNGTDILAALNGKVTIETGTFSLIGATNKDTGADVTISGYNYTKIGKLVFVDGIVPTGGVNIAKSKYLTGLPFTPKGPLAYLYIGTRTSTADMVLGTNNIVNQIGDQGIYTGAELTTGIGNPISIFGFYFTS